MGLMNKINNMVHILGNQFFAPDIPIMIPAPGATVEDTLALKDVSPERFSKLEKELVRAKGEIVRVSPLFLRKVKCADTFPSLLRCDVAYTCLKHSYILVGFTRNSASPFLQNRRWSRSQDPFQVPRHSHPPQTHSYHPPVLQLVSLRHQTDSQRTNCAFIIRYSDASCLGSRKPPTNL